MQLVRSRHSSEQAEDAAYLLSAHVHYSPSLHVPAGDAGLESVRPESVQSIKPALRPLLSLELRMRLIQCVPCAETAQAMS